MVSGTGAILMILLAAFLWGSWLQATKYTGDFPLPAFMLWLYLASFVGVWAFVGIGELVAPQGVFTQLASQPGLALFVVACGASMAVGMQLQMSVIDRVGLVLSNSVLATSGVLLGTALTAVLGGLPENVSMLKIFLTAGILICATFVCQYSGKLRDRDLARAATRPAATQDTKAALLCVLASLLITAYPLGMSLGVSTEYSQGGFSTFACIGLLATGSFLGTLVYSGIRLARAGQWNQVLTGRHKKAIALACLSGVCHYGGNLIHVLASPAISVAVSWLIGRSANMWTYLWGIFHKEYKGASVKAYLVLCAGILVYIVGVVLLARSVYTA